MNRPEMVSQAALARVKEAIESLSYVRNSAARTLRNGVTTTVGFVVPDGQNPFYNEVVRGSNDEASRRGIAIIHANPDGDVARQRTYFDLFMEQRYVGYSSSPRAMSPSRLTAPGSGESASF